MHFIERDLLRKGFLIVVMLIGDACCNPVSFFPPFENLGGFATAMVDLHQTRQHSETWKYLA